MSGETSEATPRSARRSLADSDLVIVQFWHEEREYRVVMADGEMRLEPAGSTLEPEAPKVEAVPQHPEDKDGLRAVFEEHVARVREGK